MNINKYAQECEKKKKSRVQRIANSKDHEPAFSIFPLKLTLIRNV